MSPRTIGTSQTGSLLSNQVLLLRKEVEEMRELMMDALRQMLLISQVQAENTRELTRAMQAIISVPSVQGGGTSRVRDEDTELREWREARDAQANLERPEKTIGATLNDPSNDW